jgi:hypothetical protein
MIYTAGNYPTEKVKEAIKAGMTDDTIIKNIFNSDWSYIHFVTNIRRVLVASLKRSNYL